MGRLLRKLIVITFISKFKYLYFFVLTKWLLLSSILQQPNQTGTAGNHLVRGPDYKVFMSFNGQ